MSARRYRRRTVGRTFTSAPPKTILRPCPACHQLVKHPNGLLFRYWREQAGVSQRELAQRIGLSSPYLSDVESNRRSASLAVQRAYEALRDGHRRR